VIGLFPPTRECARNVSPPSLFARAVSPRPGRVIVRMLRQSLVSCLTPRSLRIRLRCVARLRCAIKCASAGCRKAGRKRTSLPPVFLLLRMAYFDPNESYSSFFPTHPFCILYSYDFACFFHSFFHFLLLYRPFYRLCLPELLIFWFSGFFL